MREASTGGSKRLIGEAPWKLQDPDCQLLPRSPPQTHYRVGGTRGQDLLSRGPMLSLPSITGSSNAPLALKAQILCS